MKIQKRYSLFQDSTKAKETPKFTQKTIKRRNSEISFTFGFGKDRSETTLDSKEEYQKDLMIAYTKAVVRDQFQKRETQRIVQPAKMEKKLNC